ncbi:MAG TPA: TonB-dependent siderophore receptor [Steroidobacteraceae bacterium]|jgi:iron complex outermembrane receptor protein|nr:TonB-dependent siderophore receptor [Steroidobacteraceae bacterium]
MNKATYLLLAGISAVGTGFACADEGSPPQSSASQTTLPRITVIGTQVAENNYRVDKLDSIGPLGTTSIQDTPYTIEVLPLDLIQNSQAVNFKDVSKYLPLVAYQEQQGPDILRPQTRGMQGGNFQNSKIDGMTMFITVATAMEQFQQIEVLSGLSASQYGPANPSGMFNFVSKRPTQNDLHEVDVTYNSNSIATTHLDFGGPIDKNDVFSYRLNALYGGGGAWVDDSHQRRALGDLGVDVRPFERTVLELNYTDYHLTDTGYPGWFTYGQKIKLPSAPDPKWVGYGQSYLGTDLRTETSTARIKHDFNSDWHLVVGGLNQDATRNITTPVNNLTSNSGAYTSSIGATFAPRFVITSDTAYLDGNFSTFGVDHDLVIGSAGYRSQSYSLLHTPTAAQLLLGKASIDSPESYPYPAQGIPDPYENYDSSNVYQQGVNVNDMIRFNPYWAVRLGASQDWFHTDNYNTRSMPTTEYAAHGVSPTGSLVFNPTSNQTLYATFASSLQAGDLAPTGTVNSGESLAPYRSKEYEVGYKATIDQVNLTAAVFRIQRPFANINDVDNVFEITGEQVNKGVEFSAVGEVIRNVTVYGGLTLLNARLENTPLASTNDKLFVGAPKIKGNVLVEYRIPTVPGLVASVDYQFTGPRAGDDTNSFTVAGYNLIDLGLRYTSTIRSLPVTWRLAVDNIADRYYYSTVGPSDLTGANTGSLLAHFGSPRTVLASASMGF